MACFFLERTANNVCSCDQKRQKRPILPPTSGGIFNREWQHWCRIMLSLKTLTNSSSHLRLSPITGEQTMCSYLTPRLGTQAGQFPRSVLSATLLELARSVPGSRDLLFT